MIPALFTRTSTGCCHFSANSRTDVRLARSRGQTSTSPCISAAARRPRSSSRTAKITRAPLVASAAAVTRPIPLLAPVTITVRPDCGGIRSAVHLVTTVNLVGGHWPLRSAQFGRGQDQRFCAVWDWLGQTDQRHGSDDARVGHHAVDDPLKVGVGARHDSAPEVARSGDGPALEDLWYLRQSGGELISPLVLEDLQCDESGHGVTKCDRRDAGCPADDHAVSFQTVHACLHGASGQPQTSAGLQYANPWLGTEQVQNPPVQLIDRWPLGTGHFAFRSAVKTHSIWTKCTVATQCVAQIAGLRTMKA